MGGQLVNGAIGSIPGFEHFKEILTTSFTPKKIDILNNGFVNTTGAGALAVPYS